MYANRFYRRRNRQPQAVKIPSPDKDLSVDYDSGQGTQNPDKHEPEMQAIEPPDAEPFIRSPIMCVNTPVPPTHNDFVQHLRGFIGETVTVFVMGGGLMGAGFTGILLNTGESYITLITAIGAPPFTGVSKAYNYNDGNYNRIGEAPCYPNQLFRFSPTGSCADIPIDKIVSFVHNLKPGINH